MTKKRNALLGAAAMLLTGSAVANVQYSFQALDPDYGHVTGARTKSFTLTLDHFLAADESFAADALDACHAPTGACRGLHFVADGHAAGLTGMADVSVLQFRYSMPSGATAWMNYFFANADFGQAGVYQSLLRNNRAELVVAGAPLLQPDRGTVPEPSTVACVLGGLALLGAARRRPRA